NAGSKLVIAAAGPKRRDLGTTPPQGMVAKVILPGILVTADRQSAFRLPPSALSSFPLIVLTDDADFAAASLDNFLWTTFTRSDPAQDVHGVGEFTEHKHWGCKGSLIIDARLKPHMPPPCEPDAEVSRRVDKIFPLPERGA